MVKSKSIEQFLEKIAGRTTALASGYCIPPPFGCGRKIYLVEEVWDELSIKEYGISGLCIDCQRKVFGS
jgi:hypothetical protein